MSLCCFYLFGVIRSCVCVCGGERVGLTLEQMEGVSALNALLAFVIVFMYAWTRCTSCVFITCLFYLISWSFFSFFLFFFFPYPSQHARIFSSSDWFRFLEKDTVCVRDSPRAN